MKKLRKGLFIGSLATLGLCILLLMLWIVLQWLFKKNLFEYQIYWRTLVVSAILCVDCFFNNTALSVMKKTKVLSFASIILLNLASILGLVIFVFIPDTNTVPEWYAKVVGVLAITAAFFTMIISTNGKLGNHVKAIKIIYFSLIIIIDLIIFGCILSDKLNVFKLLDNFVFPFVLICIAAFALMCVTSIMGRHYKDEAAENAPTLNEVDELKKEIERLTFENNQLKAMLEEYKNKEEN